MLRLRQATKLLILSFLMALRRVRRLRRKRLLKKGLLSELIGCLKILGDGALDKKLVVYADAFSKSAAAAITSGGGQVHLVREEK